AAEAEAEDEVVGERASDPQLASRADAGDVGVVVDVVDRFEAVRVPARRAHQEAAREPERESAAPRAGRVLPARRLAGFGALRRGRARGEDGEAGGEKRSPEAREV